MAVAAHFVRLVAAIPREEGHRWGVADIEAGLQSTKCDLADGDRGGTAEVEIIAIPQIGLDNAPAADRWQPAGAVMSAPPAASAAVPDCRRRQRR